MLKECDIPRLAQLGLAASIQPQHAMDDRDVIARFWGTPAGIPYAFNSLHKAGTKLLMGSDAPVAPLDPWLAISAAVFGTESSDREPFQPEQCLDFETRSLRPPRSDAWLCGTQTRPIWCFWTVIRA